MRCSVNTNYGAWECGVRMWVSHIKNRSFLLLLAQPYWIQNVLHQGRSVHIINNQKIHKNQYFLKKGQEKKGKSVHIKKCLKMLIKQHKIAIKKVELCEAAPYYWGFAPDSFFYSLKRWRKRRRRRRPGHIISSNFSTLTNSCTVMSLVRMKLEKK